MHPSFLDKQNAVWAISATLIGACGEDFKTTTDYNSMEQICEVVNGRIFGYKLEAGSGFSKWAKFMKPM